MLNNYQAENGTASNPAVRAPFVGTRDRQAKWKQPALHRETPTVKNALAKRLLADRTDADYARLALQMQTVAFSAGKTVFQAGGSIEYVYLPETAVFSQMNMLEDGRTIETAMVGSDGIIGLAAILGFHQGAAWTQTLIAGSALRLSAKVFRQEFERGGALQPALLGYINSYIAQISQRAVCNNHHHIEEKFCTWLLMLADRCGRNKLVLTQEQISQFLGVHRPSVTCIAQSLRDRGLIDYVRGRIFILDRNRLENNACECYSAIL